MSVAIQPEDADADHFERDTLARVARRCIPLLLLGYIIAFIDRVNIGFAAITASRDLGMSPSVFGFGAGMFFISYLIFEVPSNYVLERVGARKWMARIMVTCGFVAGAMVFVRGPRSFYTIRFLLGAVEAGLFPGVMLYLTYWFPAKYRARYVSMFAIGIPMASVIGSPISGLILNMDGVLGFKGWQWLYVLEAIPGVILGVLIWYSLTDQPRDAKWLTPEQRDWLQRTIDAERAAHSDVAARHSFLQSLGLLADLRVIIFALVFFGTAILSYTLSFWMPLIGRYFGMGYEATGLISAIPFAFGSIAMLLWACLSDRTSESDWHAAIAAFGAAAGMLAYAFLTSPLLTVIALSFAALGFLQLLRLLLDRRVFILSIVFFGTGMPSYALSFWTPQIVHDFGLSNVATGLVSAIPFACGSIAMLIWARHSDRARERDWHTAIAAFVAAAGMVACWFLTSPLLTMVALSFAALGVFGLKGPFLSAISQSFSKQTAAVGIAMVVSIGNLSGSASPWLIGFIKQEFGGYPRGLLAVGVCSLIGGLFMFLRPKEAR